MIIEVRAKNCFAFEKEICISLNADMRSKKLQCNVFESNNKYNILKTAIIYGPNNVGKTCLIKCIRAIKSILLNNGNKIQKNIFSKETISTFGITFVNNNRVFSYDIRYDTNKEEFIYEKFSELTKDEYNNEKETVWLLRDYQKKDYQCIDVEIIPMMNMISNNNLLCYLVNVDNFKHLHEMKRIIVEFADKIEIVNMNNIPISQTIKLMKSDSKMQEKISNFVKNADLYMDKFEYVDEEKIKMIFPDNEKPEEDIFREVILDQIRLTSTYKGISIPSIIFDSTGTKKIASLAGYIIDSLENGKILVVDELDSSIHFKLTRAIVAMFNNELNDNAQMLFTAHDISLMDCKKLFRKEQVWFLHKDNSGIYSYPLSVFSASQGVRADTTDILEKYKKGVLGAIPSPDMIKSLLDIKTDVLGVVLN